MDTLLFIHGTGVRREGFDATMKKLRSGLDRGGLAHVGLEGVNWGETLGANVTKEDIDAVLPSTRTRALLDEGDWEAALWSELMSDPLTEMRLASLRQDVTLNPAAPVLPGQPPATVDLDTKFARLKQTLADPLPGEVGAAQIRVAADWVQGQQATRDAAARSSPMDEEYLVAATARAIVAKALVNLRGEPGAGPSALYLISARTALVDAVRLALSPATKGVFGWLFDRVRDFAAAKATAVGRNRRDGLMNLVSPGIGDILLYQRRGNDILAVIEKRAVELAEKSDRLVVLGHSLGGIMLVDLLSLMEEDIRRRVKLLVTAGSQSPILFKFDALGTLRPKTPMPAGLLYTPWLNVYDRNDFLSFCAARAFPGIVTGITDFEVDCGVPFPEAHSAYFSLDGFYGKLAEMWPKP
jgi:hypothetical protein